MRSWGYSFISQNLPFRRENLEYSKLLVSECFQISFQFPMWNIKRLRLQNSKFIRFFYSKLGKEDNIDIWGGCLLSKSEKYIKPSLTSEDWFFFPKNNDEEALLFYLLDFSQFHHHKTHPKKSFTTAWWQTNPLSLSVKLFDINFKHQIS